MLHWDRQVVTTFLTLVIVGVWIVTAVVRIWVPLLDAPHILDALMPMVCGYWFLSNAAAKKNGNGTSA